MFEDGGVSSLNSSSSATQVATVESTVCNYSATPGSVSIHHRGVSFWALAAGGHASVARKVDTSLVASGHVQSSSKAGNATGNSEDSLCLAAAASSYNHSARVHPEL